jgi:hypothetical protein
MPVTRYSSEKDTPSLPGSVPLGNPGRVPDESREDAGTTLSQAEKSKHIQSAVRNLRQAVILEQRQETAAGFSQNGLSELTLACVYEEGKDIASKVWREEAIRFYRLAFERSLQNDLKRSTAPIFGIDTLVSHEAAKSYLRLVRQRGVRTHERKTIAQVEQSLRQLVSLPRSNVVTPIIFALDRVRPLSSLVAPHPQGMAFDLDGSARAKQRYSAWPRANTGILVWDPEHTGRITSGRQLFGNATWWIFWENGYRALQSLDDNGDGWLTRGELGGLGVWTDKNSNGKCENGEVRPIMRTGIAGLNVRSVRRTGNGWVCRNGILLDNGTILPTYDWVAKTVLVP